MKVLTPSFSPRQNALVVGGLLGDSHMQKNLSSTGNCRLRFSHSSKQKPYLEWKYDNLKDFCKTTKGIIPDKRDRKTGIYTSYIFYTGYMKIFNSIQANWYIPTIGPNPKIGEDEIRYVKTVPANLNKLLTDPLALSVWYLDDGTKRTDTESCRLATQSFSKEGNEIIRDCLLDNFGIRSSIESWGRNKKGQVIYQIAILSSKNGGDYVKFRNLIKPIVAVEVPSMLYKLP